MLSSLVLALALHALPRCELPDLDKSYATSAPDHSAQLLDGVLGVAMTDPTGDDGERLSGVPQEPVPARKHSDASVWLWSPASDWLLVPRGFEVSLAKLGVDGSWVIELRDASSPDGRLRASSTGACVGCAYSAGAAYFDSYAAAARDNEFEFCKGLERPIVRDSESDRRLRFHYDNPRGQRHDAVVAIAEGVGYTELVVSGLDAGLRDEILEAFGL